MIAATTEELTGVEGEVRSLIARAVALRMAGDSQGSFDLLTASERLVESVSVSRQGRFYNQRALALKDLKEYDRAILEFDRAAYCFEESGEVELQGMVHNNIARAYSLSGNYTRARESVNKAIGLTTNPTLLAQWGDQLANVLLDEGKFELAEIEVDKALSLLVDREQVALLAECLDTKNRCMQQKNGTCRDSVYMVSTNSRLSSNLFRSPRGEQMPRTILECAQRIIRDDHELAMPLLTLMALAVDPNGDPDRYGSADEAMQFLAVKTPDGEAFCRSLIDSLANSPQEISDSSS